jgi:hypothetical protein
MTERSDDLQRSRHEAALLLRLDPSNLSPSDALRCDLVATLRLSIDGAQADALEGRAADLGRLIVATESLVKLLPSETPKPASSGLDPRQIMLRTYLEMRRRGELAYEQMRDSGAMPPTYESMRAEVERLLAEIAALRAGAPAPGSGETIPRSSGASSGPNGPVGETNVAVGGNVVPLRTDDRSSLSPSPPAAASKPAPAAPAVVDLQASRANGAGGGSGFRTGLSREAWRNFVKIDWQG